LPAAELLFKAIDDQEGLEAVARERVVQRPYERIAMIGLAVFFLGIFIAIGLAYVPVDKWFGWPVHGLDWPRRIITGLAIAGIGLLNVVNRSALWRVALVAAGGFSVTIAAAWLGASLLEAGIAGFFGTAVFVSVLMPSPSTRRLAELQASPNASSKRPFAGLALRAAGWLQHYSQNRQEKKP
jgi:hypothetical protein